MSIFRKASILIGFTETEIKIILFILSSLVIGLVINYVKEKTNNNDLLQFNYSKQDSLFYAGDFIDANRDTNEKIMEKAVDSKRELLDFNGAKYIVKNVKSSELSIESIDINNASQEELMTLPGIGEKTSALILEYRNKKGRFDKIEDILNIRGIGKAKLERLKKFIIVK